MGQYEEALKSLETAERLQSDSPLLNTIMFDKGRINLILWLNQSAPNESERYRNADINFQAFLDRKGDPSHWAFYHLACLAATRTRDVSLTAEAKAQFRSVAINNLERAVNELANYRSNKSLRQRRMMRTLLANPESWVKETGSPVCCPALIDVWTDTRGSIDSLTRVIN